MLNEINVHSSYVPLEKISFLEWLEKHNVGLYANE